MPQKNGTLYKKEAKDKRGRIWTPNTIKDLLERSDKAVIRGMNEIFRFQTLDEQNYETTMYYNTVGFSGAHAEIMSSLAKFYESRKYLSPKQMVVARKIIKRYAGQLIKIMRGDIQEPKPPMRIGRRY